jgi:hypothetical protein
MEVPASHVDAVRMYGPEFTADPAAFYREIRAARGAVTPVLLLDDVPAWLVLGYGEVRYVYDNPQLGRVAKLIVVLPGHCTRPARHASHRAGQREGSV